MNAYDIERALTGDRARREQLVSALYAAVGDLWFAAEAVAIGGGTNGANISLSLQRNAWDAERVARGLPTFMGMENSELRPTHAERLPSPQPEHAT